MNEKQVSFEDFRKEQKKRERKEKLYNVVKKCTDWIQSNKEIAIGIGTFAVGAGGSMIKGLAKRQKVKEEKQLKNNYCYDRSLGHYWKLRRELTNEEWIAIDKRKRNGERLGDILAELKVLKNSYKSLCLIALALILSSAKFTVSYMKTISRRIKR